MFANVKTDMAVHRVISVSVKIVEHYCFLILIELHNLKLVHPIVMVKNVKMCVIV